MCRFRQGPCISTLFTLNYVNFLQEKAVEATKQKEEKNTVYSPYSLKSSSYIATPLNVLLSRENVGVHRRLGWLIFLNML
jgi:hypothetical protein